MPGILITGGSGFIGCQLAQIAARGGHRVTVTTAVNSPSERSRFEMLAKAGIQPIIAKLDDGPALARALEGQDAVIHLAAAQHEAEAPESYFHRVNVEGTRHLLDLASKAGVRRFVHGSTIGVYGGDANGLLHEESPIAPDNAYGRTKAKAEELVRAYRGPMETCIVRISETYGPGDMRLLKLFRAISRGRYFTIGSGRNEHQLIYVEDLVRGLLSATTRQGVAGSTFILAGRESISTDAMAAAIGAAVNRNGRVVHLPLLPFHVAAMAMESTFSPLGLKPPLHRRRLDFFRKTFRFSTARAEELLGFRAEVPFTEGARRTAEWYRAHGML